MTFTKVTEKQRKMIAAELQLQMPEMSASDRDRFVSRAAATVEIYLTPGDCTSLRQAKRSLATMRSSLASLREAHSRSGDEVQKWIEAGLRSAGYSKYDAEHYFSNLESLDSVIGIVIKLYERNRRVGSGRPSESIVSSLAADWADCFGIEPTTTAEGPFDSVANVVHQVAFGTDLNRRRLLAGLRLPRPKY